MQDAWRAYLELALGLTEASKKRAQTVARKLVGQSGATASQLQGMAEELISTGMANREALTKIVRFEVDRALGVLGLATTDEVADLTERVRQLERELREALAAAPTGANRSAGPGGPPAGSGTPVAHAGSAGASPPAGKAVAGKVVAKKAAANKTAANKTVAKRTAAAKTVAKRTPANKTVAKKATVAGRGATGTARNQAAAEPATKATKTKRIEAKKLPPAAKKTAPRKTSASKRSPAPGAGAA